MSLDLEALARICERQRQITDQRDAAICAGREAGASLRELARASGLSAEGVRRIVARHAEGSA